MEILYLAALLFRYFILPIFLLFLPSFLFYLCMKLIYLCKFRNMFVHMIPFAIIIGVCTYYFYISSVLDYQNSFGAVSAITAVCFAVFYTSVKNWNEPIFSFDLKRFIFGFPPVIISTITIVFIVFIMFMPFSIGDFTLSAQGGNDLKFFSNENMINETSDVIEYIKANYPGIKDYIDNIEEYREKYKDVKLDYVESWAEYERLIQVKQIFWHKVYVVELRENGMGYRLYLLDNGKGQEVSWWKSV